MTTQGLARTAGIAIVAALVLVSIVFLIAQAATDLLVTLPGSDTPEEFVLSGILPVALLGGVVGAVLAWVIGRFAPRPRITFFVVCIVGLALFGILAFTAAEETATAVWLNLMHLAVALPVVGGLAMYLPHTRD